MWCGTYVCEEVVEKFHAVWWMADILPGGKRWAMIDSVASACVCGMDWYSWINEDATRQIQASEKVFRFGDGNRIRSEGYVAMGTHLLYG